MLASVNPVVTNGDFWDEKLRLSTRKGVTGAFHAQCRRDELRGEVAFQGHK